MTEKVRQELLERLGRGDGLVLPPLPDLALRVLRKTQEPAATPETVAAQIVADQALSAQVMRLANSTTYAGRVAVRSLSQAVIRVGVRAVGALVVANLHRPLYAHGDPRAAAYLKALWRHALGCGLLARQIARRLRDPDTEGSFLAGLLHDVGKTAVVALSAPPAAGVPWPDEAEVDALHGEAAERLLSQWRLPPDIAGAVAQHHAPLAGVQHPRLTAVVKLADAVCHAVGLSTRPQERSEAALEAREHLGLSEIQVADLEVELEDRVTELDAVLSAKYP